MSTTLTLRSTDAAPASAIAGTVDQRRTRAISYTRRRIFNALALGLTDVVALSASMLASSVVLRQFGLDHSITPAYFSVILVWLAGASITNLLPSWGLGPVEELRRYTSVLVLTMIASMIVILSQGNVGPSTLWPLACAPFLAFVLVPVCRLRVKRILIARNMWGVPTVIFGAGSMGMSVYSLLQKEDGLGYRPIGLYRDYPSTGNIVAEDLRVAGSVDRPAEHAPVAIVIISDIGQARARALLEGPLSSYSAVLVIPDLFEAPSLWIRPRDLNGVLGLEIRYNLSSPFARLLKRSFDMLVVLLAAPLWLPTGLILAALIWLQDFGNPLFIQERIGSSGERFRTYKFRTMLPDAEAVLRRRLEEDEDLRREWETFWKLKQDPRITRVGHFLRKLSLDELPQLINVLEGTMSLVGPRPLPQYHNDELSGTARDLRERVRPGITGLWQVSGRSDAGTKGMETWDPYYVRNWSLWLDAVILTRTARAVISRRGAY